MTMRFKLLGTSGVRVAELALGTMTFGNDWGWGAEPDVAGRIFEAYTAAGGNFIDTSNNYTNGSAERIVGDLIAAERDYYFVASKYTLQMATGNRRDPNLGGNSRKSMMRSVEGTLKRLKTEYLDLLYLHMWDFTTPVEEVLRGVDDLVRSGKLLYFAFSDTPAWIVAQAVTMANLRGWTAPIACQFPYSVLSRAAERDVMPMCRILGLAMLPWGLLGGGALTGKYNAPSDEPRRNSSAGEAQLKMAETLGALALEIGRTPSQVAINFVRQQPGQVIPILGARSEAQIVDNLGVLDFALTGEQLQRLRDAAPFKLDFPLDFLTSDNVRNLCHGETWALLDNRHPQPLG